MLIPAPTQPAARLVRTHPRPTRDARGFPLRRAAALALVGVMGSTVLAGCQSSRSSSTPPPVQKPAAYQAADRALAQGVAAAQRGDFDGLRTKATTARDLAMTPRQERLAEDLLALSRGADALLAQKPDEAASHWASIEDPSLRSQVLRGADAMGLHVPSSSHSRASRTYVSRP